MSVDSPQGEIRVWSDFTGDNDSVLTETETTATQDITDKHGGWWRHTLSTGEAEIALIASERVYEADEGAPLIFEIRLQTSVVASAAIFAGFHDNNTESATIIGDEDGTMVTTATDAFGFMLEEGDATWQAVGVQNDVDNNSGGGVALTLGADAVNTTIQTLRLEANPNTSGTVRYYIDGALVSTQTSWFRSSIVYCIGAMTDGRATAYNTDYDYLYATAPRS